MSATIKEGDFVVRTITRPDKQVVSSTVLRIGQIIDDDFGKPYKVCREGQIVLQLPIDDSGKETVSSVRTDMIFELDNCRVAFLNSGYDEKDGVDIYYRRAKWGEIWAERLTGTRWSFNR